MSKTRPKQVNAIKVKNGKKVLEDFLPFVTSQSPLNSLLRFEGKKKKKKGRKACHVLHVTQEVKLTAKQKGESIVSIERENFVTSTALFYRKHDEIDAERCG